MFKTNPIGRPVRLIAGTRGAQRAWHKCGTKLPSEKNFKCPVRSRMPPLRLSQKSATSGRSIWIGRSDRFTLKSSGCNAASIMYADLSMRENRHIGFLIVTNFSMVGFLCALSVFRNANLVIGREFYETNVLAETVEPVTASVGISVAPDHALSSEVIPDLVFVCAGTDPQWRYSERIGGWLRRIAQRGTVMGAISTGADL